MASGQIDPRPHKYWLSVEFLKAYGQKNLLAYGQPKETVAAIMILYRNTKVKVRSPDGDTDYFDIVAGMLQGDTHAFIICEHRLIKSKKTVSSCYMDALHGR